jgi:SAM-dependent methyltransferase
VLDLGCGTGTHSHLLAQRGYEVVGVDRSAPMLERARMVDSGATFFQADISSVDLKQRFDAVVLMFAVLGYQLTNADVLGTLHAARRHLEAEGLLGFDVWYGPAVLAQRPSLRTRTVDQDGRSVTRMSSGTLDVRRHRVRVDFELTYEGDVAPFVSEAHEMRFFFPLELEHYLEESGFSLVRLGAFPQFDVEPDESSWSVFVVARAI